MIRPLTQVVLTKAASCSLLTAHCLLFSEPRSRSGYCPGASMIHPLTRVVLTKLASARCLLLTAFYSLSPPSRSGYCPGASMIHPLTQVVLTKTGACSAGPSGSSNSLARFSALNAVSDSRARLDHVRFCLPATHSFCH